MSKTLLIVIFLLVSLMAFYIYQSQQLPVGIDTKGEDLAKSNVALATSIVGLVGAIVTLISKLVEIKGKARKK